MKSTFSSSIGLVGDGDEIAAIEEVEVDFGVNLNGSDAVNWFTAGDVYRSLNTSLSVQDVRDQTNWLRFAAAICRETGVDPATIGPNTPLLGEPGFWSSLPQASVALWAIVAMGVLLAVVLSTL